ncbi:hypothetical protein [Streptomyces pratensis]|uniref:hypothetical protein n=1 Tax=Streptomyces pratensis TaxID=1169025 RepID=UPI0030193851
MTGRAGLPPTARAALFAAVDRACLFCGSRADLCGRQQDLGVVTDHANGAGPGV